MSDFIKPKSAFVSDAEYIQTLVNTTLRKDLHDNEEICANCHGTGLTVIDNRYGLSDDPDKKTGVFPYTHQSFSFCRHCFHGVVRRCEYCGEILPKGYLKHNCQQQKEVDKIESDAKALDVYEQAKKLTVDEYEAQYPGNMVYYEGSFFSDVNELLDSLWGEYDGKFENMPDYCYGTVRETIRLDADNILTYVEENAECEDLEFDSQGYEELKSFLEEWNNKYERDYFYDDETIVVLIPEGFKVEAYSEHLIAEFRAAGVCDDKNS